MASLQKNVSGQNLTFALVNATTGAGLAGASVTVNVTKDGAAQAAGGGTVTSQGLGQYNYAPTQAETNATDVGFFFTATNAIPVNMDFHTDLTDANSFIKVDVEDWKGTAVASPATAGIPDINVKNIVNVAAALDANSLLKVDTEDWKGTAVASPATAGVPDINVKNIVNVAAALDANNLLKVDTEDWKGTAVSTPATAGIPDINVKNIVNAAAAIDGNNLLKVDTEDWKGTAVAAPATAGIPDINVKNIVNVAAAIDGNNLLKVDTEDINGIALAAQALAQSTQSICWGTCSGGSTTTAIVGTLHNPSSLTASGQLNGRTIIFLGNTGTGGMQAQASNITASTTGATPTITFTAMTTAPVNGDVFVIL